MRRHRVAVAATLLTAFGTAAGLTVPAAAQASGSPGWRIVKMIAEPTALRSTRSPGSARADRLEDPAVLAPGTITTIGGGVGGPALATRVGIGDPCALTFSGGKLYVGDVGGVLASGAVRAISLRTGWLTTPVGSGLLGFTRDGGPAIGKLGFACGLATDRWGNLVFSDGEQHSVGGSLGNDRVRVLAAQSGTFYGQGMRAGHLYTIAGTGAYGHSGDGGKATRAKLDNPGGLAIDQAGNLIVADDQNDRIRVIAGADGSFYGVRMHRGDIYTVAGNGTFGTAGLGGPATKAELELRYGESHGGVNFPSSSVRIDHQGNLVIADPRAGLVLVLAAHPGSYYGQQMTVGHLYTVAGGGNGTGSGGPATAASLTLPNWLAIDHAGNVLISQDSPSRIGVVAVRTGRFYGKQMTAGDIYSLRLGSRAPVSVDGAGNVIVAGNGGAFALADRTGRFYGRQMSRGHIYQIAGISFLRSLNPSGPATSIETGPDGSINDATVDGEGNLVLSTDASVFILAARSGPGYGRHLVRGHFYTIASCKIDRASRTATELCPFGTADRLFISGVAVDGNGNLVLGGNFSNGNGLWVAAIHSGRFYGRAMKAGTIYRVAGGGSSLANGVPSAQAQIFVNRAAVERSGNVIVSDGTRVRLITVRSGIAFGQHTKAHHVYTIGGGGNGTGSGVPGRSVRLSPDIVRVDRAGNVLLTDVAHNLVRVIAASTGTFYGRDMVAGDIYTIAGGGSASGNGVPARTAALHPLGLAVDGRGNVIVSDTFPRCCVASSRVRVVATRSGEFYGQHMTAGRIYTIAGRGPVGFSGDGGPGTQAMLQDAASVTFWPGRGVVIADGIRLRLIAG